MTKTIWLSLVACVLSMLPTSGSAAITYNFGLSNLVGKSSANSSLLGYEVRLGKFATGFTPTVANYDQWLSNFTLLPSSVFTLGNDGDSFVEPAVGDFGPFVSSVESFGLSSNVAGFSGGDPLYVWISNATTSGANTQVALFTDSTWQYVNVTGGVQPNNSILFENENPSLLVGTSFDDSYTDGGGETGIRLVTQNINAVPEPTQSLLIFVGLAALVGRRMRRSLI